MKELKVYVEIEGEQVPVGEILCSDINEANFIYCKEYLQRPRVAPISISLPLQTEPFSAEKTKRFFEGLLPEGFTRKSVAQWMHVDEDDYIAILAGLGNECLGAIRVTTKADETMCASYERLVGNTDNHIKNLSLLYDGSLKGIRLAPAYDIISTTIYENSTREMGIAIGGQTDIDRIDRSKFVEQARQMGIGQRAAMKHFDTMCDRFE